MKKLLLSTFACLVVSLFAVVIWLQFPRVHEPERLQAMQKSAQVRFQKLQAEATNPEKNGFLNPTFLPYWGRKGQEYQLDSPVEVQVKAWLEYSSAGQQKLIDHKALQSDPKYLAARADFQKLAPELLISIAKPVFVAPETTISLDLVVMNFIAVRASAQALIGLAEDSAAQDRMSEAADLTVSVVEFGRTLQNQIYLIGDMIGIAVEAIGVDGFVGLIDPQTKLTAEQWKQLTGRLVSAIPPQDQLAMVMESETNACLATLQMLRKGQSISVFDEISGFGLLNFPGVLSHEERIFCNMSVETDRVLRSSDNQKYPSFIENPSNLDYLTGRVGLLGMVLLPNYSRAGIQMQFTRAKVTGLALATGMIAYRKGHGKLPSDFEQVRAAGIAVPDKAVIEAVGATYADGAITLPFHGHLIGDPSTDTFLYGPRPWYQIKDSVITFRP